LRSSFETYFGTLRSYRSLVTWAVKTIFEGYYWELEEFS